MKITLVCGGRDYNNPKYIFSVLDNLPISCIVHGGANGVDRTAGMWAICNKIPEIVVNPQWENFGRSAGPIRNSWMLRFINIETVVAFPGGSGTENMVSQAQKSGIEVLRF